ALGRPGARASLAVELGTEFLTHAIVGPGARALGIGPLAVRAGARSWIVGTGDPAAGEPEALIAAAIASGDPEPCCERPPRARLTVEPFELFRAFTGRRSAAQVRALDWSGNPE